jgi:hypothetical protein
MSLRHRGLQLIEPPQQLVTRGLREHEGRAVEPPRTENRAELDRLEPRPPDSSSPVGTETRS